MNVITLSLVMCSALVTGSLESFKIFRPALSQDNYQGVSASTTTKTSERGDLYVDVVPIDGLVHATSTKTYAGGRDNSNLPMLAGTSIAEEQEHKTSVATSTNDGNTLSVVVPSDAYQLHYLANFNIGDGVINITNTGALGTDPFGPLSGTTGRLCANVYAFDPAQDLISCCSCLVSPDGLKSLSARGDLISNTLTVSVPTSIIIKLIASTPVNGTCDPSSPTPSNLAEGMRAWGTTIHARSTIPASYGITEEAFQNAYLSPGALTQVTTLCRFIQGNGGGHGICKSCRTGGLGAAKLDFVH